MAAEADIDLYDAIEEDYTQEQEDELLNGNDNGTDLYDDVITAPTKNDNSDETSAPNDGDEASNDASTVSNTAGDVSAGKFMRKWSVYISNLTWWTTDVDLTQACNAIGVNDVVEIKFYENRANGQSKGFATVSVQSAESMNKLMEKVKTVQIHSQTPNVHYCNRQNLLMLDAATGGNRYEIEQERNAQYQQHNGMRFGPPRVPRPPFQPGGPAPMARPPMAGAPRVMPPRPGMPMGHMPPGARPPYMQAGGLPPRSMPGMAPTNMANPGMQQGGMRPAGQGFPPQNYPPGVVPGMMPTGGPPTSQAPAAHINPAFFPGGAPPEQFRGSAPVVLDAYGRPVEGPPSSKDQQPQLSEDEFQEILTRNKSVSSSAISRAVQDASQGDFASAIETLVTAISLIKQSKIASDDRCKILIASLQDTKQGIEDKSYGGSSRERRRSRSRERDRDRRRERSRSRERDRRDYRERSRERGGDRGMERERGGYYSDRRDRYY